MVRFPVVMLSIERARDVDQDLPALERAHLVGVGLHHGVADRDLAVAAQGHVAVTPDAENGRRVYALHVSHERGCAW